MQFPIVAILLIHLPSCGIVGTLWSWFKCYLTIQIQQVSFKIKNILSDTVLPVISGVPHGGSLMILVYMNSILSGVQASQVLKFADDMKLSPDDCIKFQHAGYQFLIFLSHLTVNFTTCVHIPFKSTSNTRYLITNIEINCQETQKDMGSVTRSGHTTTIP